MLFRFMSASVARLSHDSNLYQSGNQDIMAENVGSGNFSKAILAVKVLEGCRDC